MCEKKEKEFNFFDAMMHKEITIYCEKIRHPSKVIGVGDTIESAVADAKKQADRILRFGNYQHIAYEKGGLVLRNNSLFYHIPNITLYRGEIIYDSFV